jgi:hypothetical protein
MKAAFAVATALALWWATVSWADRASVVYAVDGGAELPRLSARRAFEAFNSFPVAICIAPGTSVGALAPCRPLLPGGTLSLEVSDSARYAFRLCSGATVASCMGDGGVVLTEIQ